MVEIKVTDIVYSEPPEITISNVQYWSRHTKELQHNQSHKALLLLEHDCIQYIGPDEEFGSKHCFICLPLNTEEEWKVDGRIFKKKPLENDYNTSEYKIFKNTEGNFCCSCQGWNTKNRRGEIPAGGAGCSHVLALYYAFKIKKFGRNHGAEEHHMRPDPQEKLLTSQESG